MKRQLAVVAAASLAVAAAVFSAQGQVKAKVDEKADGVLKAMSEFYGKKTSATLQAELNVDQTFQGKSMKTQRSYDIAFARPNKLLVDVKGDARGGTVVSDGNNLTVYIQQLSRYTTKPAPAKLEEIASQREVMAVGGEPLSILASLFAEDPYKTITESVGAVKYLGQEKLGDRDVHRLRMESDRNATEVLIAAGDQPLMLKLIADVSAVIERAKAAGQDVKLDVSMNFSDWKFEAPESKFAFNAPPGAQAAKTLFDEEAGHPMDGREAPDFKLENLAGQTVDLASVKGKNVIILDFWATWCPPCVKGLPVMQEIANAYKDKGVVFYAVNQQESKTQIETFLKEKKLDIPVVLDKDGAVGTAYAVRGIPQTVIIDKSGKIVRVHVGFSGSMKTEIQHDLDALLAGKKLE